MKNETLKHGGGSLPSLVSGLVLHSIGTQTPYSDPPHCLLLHLTWLVPPEPCCPILSGLGDTPLIACGMCFPEWHQGHGWWWNIEVQGSYLPMRWILTIEKWVMGGSQDQLPVCLLICFLLSWTIHPCKPPWRSPSGQVDMSAEQPAISLLGFWSHNQPVIHSITLFRIFPCLFSLFLSLTALGLHLPNKVLPS